MEQPQPTRYDVWASNLLLLSLGLMTVDFYYRRMGLFGAANWLNWGIWVFVYLFLGNLYYQLRKGHRSVKTSFLAILGLSMFNAFAGDGTHMGVGADYPLKQLMSWGQTSLVAAATLLVIVSLLLEYKAKPKP